MLPLDERRELSVLPAWILGKKGQQMKENIFTLVVLC